MSSTTDIRDEALHDFTRFFKLITRYDTKHSPDPIIFFQPLPEKCKEKELEPISYFASPLSQISDAYKILLRHTKKFYSANFAINEFGSNGDVSGGRRQKNCTRIRSFTIDIDSYLSISEIEQVAKLFQPTIIVASSKKKEEKLYKIHIYFLIHSDIEVPLDTFEDFQIALAFRAEQILETKKILVKTDKQCSGLQMTLRCPGFLHQKDPENVFRSRVIFLNEKNILTQETFKKFFQHWKINSRYIQTCHELLSDMRRKKKKKSKNLSSEDISTSKDKSISRYVGRAESEGEGRNAALHQYIVHCLYMRSFTLHEAIGAALYEDEKQNDPPLGSEIVEPMVRRVWQEYLGSLSRKMLSRVRRGDSFAAKELFMESAKDELKNSLQEKKKDFSYDFSNEADFASLTSDIALASRILQKNIHEIALHPNGNLCAYNEENGLWDTTDTLAYSRMRDVFLDVVKEPAVVAQFTDHKGNLKDEVYTNFRERMFSAKRHENVATILKKTPSIITTEDSFNHNEHLLHAKNGIIDLETGLLKPFDKTQLMTFSTNFNYVQNVEKIYRYKSMSSVSEYEEGNIWTRYLIQVMDGDIEMCRFLQKILGYTLKGKNNEEKIFFLYGTGANGKSIFIETALNLLGDYTYVVPVSVFLANSRENKASILAQLPGKRLISTSEVGKQKKWDEEAIKNMSGVDKINARQIFEKSIVYRPGFKTFVRGNHKPLIEGTDLGIWRRIVLIPFDVVIPEKKRDFYLVEKLSQESVKQDLILWAIAGFQRYLDEGLHDTPQKMIDAKESYREEMNPFPTFIQSCFDSVESYTDGITCELIFEIYNLWRMENNQERLNIFLLGKKLNEENLFSQSIRSGEKGNKRSVRTYKLKVKDYWIRKLNGEDTEDAPETKPKNKNLNGSKQLLQLVQGGKEYNGEELSD